MQHVIVAIALALAILAEPQDTQRTPRASDKRTRDIYVSVVDSSGKAVTGLTAEDFTVREDGVVREVTSAGPATEQLTISMLVDDSQAAADAIQFMRDAIPAFVQRLNGKAEIAIATIGERPTNQIDYTTSTDALKKVDRTSLPEDRVGRLPSRGHRRSVAWTAEARGQAAEHRRDLDGRPRVQQSLPPAGARCALRKRSVPPRPRARPALGLDGR